MAPPIVTITAKIGVHTVIGEVRGVSSVGPVIVRCEDPYLVRFIEYVHSMAGVPVEPGPNILDYFIFPKSANGTNWHIDNFALVTTLGVKGLEFELHNPSAFPTDFSVKLRWPHSLGW